MKIKNETDESAWSRNIITPTDSYIEVTEQGSYAVREIEWIEINPVELYKAGRLTQVKEIDHTNEIVALLNDLTIKYSLHDKLIRLVPN